MCDKSSFEQRNDQFVNYMDCVFICSDDNMDMLNDRRDLVHDARESAMSFKSRSRDEPLIRSSYYG